MPAAVFCQQCPRHVWIVCQRGRIGWSRGSIFTITESKDPEVGLVISDAVLLGIDNRIASRISRCRDGLEGADATRVSGGSAIARCRSDREETLFVHIDIERDKGGGIQPFLVFGLAAGIIVDHARIRLRACRQADGSNQSQESNLQVQSHI